MMSIEDVRGNLLSDKQIRNPFFVLVDIINFCNVETCEKVGVAVSLISMGYRLPSTSINTSISSLSLERQYQIGASIPLPHQLFKISDTTYVSKKAPAIAPDII